jgi:divalent metal cation (Fe/Co/Zn/Cd) transporter
VSSVVVQGTLTIAALSTSRFMVAALDASGAAFVSGFTVYTAIRILRASLPDVLDRTVADEVHAAINRILAKHFEDYETLDRVRTRRSGELVYVEIILGFRADLTFEEVVNRIKTMTDDMHAEMANADLSVIPVSVRHSQPVAG